MKLLAKLMALFSIALVCGCSSMGGIPRDYAGADGGVLVAGLGAARGTSYSSYTMKYRTTNGAGEGSFRYLQENIFAATPRDFDDQAGNGFVAVQRLPPGDYEIYNFSIFHNGEMFQNYYSSRKDFSIKFKIVPGKTTYLGDFTAVRIQGRNFFGMPVPGGAYFVVSNKEERDIAIARRKLPSIGQVEAAIPDALAVDNPFIQAKPLL